MAYTVISDFLIVWCNAAIAGVLWMLITKIMCHLHRFNTELLRQNIIGWGIVGLLVGLLGSVYGLWKGDIQFAFEVPLIASGIVFVLMLAIVALQKLLDFAANKLLAGKGGN